MIAPRPCRSSVTMRAKELPKTARADTGYTARPDHAAAPCRPHRDASRRCAGRLRCRPAHQLDAKRALGWLHAASRRFPRLPQDDDASMGFRLCHHASGSRESSRDVYSLPCQSHVASAPRTCTVSVAVTRANDGQSPGSLRGLFRATGGGRDVEPWAPARAHELYGSSRRCGTRERRARRLSGRLRATAKP